MSICLTFHTGYCLTKIFIFLIAEKLLYIAFKDVFYLFDYLGYASTTVPMYIAEAAPAAIRGKLITMYQMSITFGQFFASVMDGFFSHDKEHGWR